MPNRKICSFGQLRAWVEPDAKSHPFDRSSNHRQVIRAIADGKRLVQANAPDRSGMFQNGALGSGIDDIAEQIARQLPINNFEHIRMNFGQSNCRCDRPCKTGKAAGHQNRMRAPTCHCPDQIFRPRPSAERVLQGIAQ